MSYKDTLDKALQCIHLARAINDRFPDQTKMPAEEVQNRKTLLAEAARLREIADTEKQQTQLETWATTPDDDQSVIQAAAQVAAAQAKVNGGADQFAAANHELNMKRFAKALRQGVHSLSAEEKARSEERRVGKECRSRWS